VVILIPKRITLYEGKYHQIKRMLAAIGNHAKYIHRTEVGPVLLGDLEPGKWRLLTEEEVTVLTENLPHLQPPKKKPYTKNAYTRTPEQE
jgi:16S rRNA U516 pseudouridylate synthase RsuA-like enzyme